MALPASMSCMHPWMHVCAVLPSSARPAPEPAVQACTGACHIPGLSCQHLLQVQGYVW
jgi:hypothetical protein